MIENKYLEIFVRGAIMPFFFLIIFSDVINGQEIASKYNKCFKDQVQVSSRIESALEGLAADPDLKIGGDRIHNIEYLTNLYQQAGFQPFWTKFEYTENALEGIRQSSDDGLLPSDYHLEAILELRDALTAGGHPASDEVPEPGELDILLTDGILQYAYHLLYGKADPVTLDPTWNFGFSPIPDLNHETFRENIANLEIPSRLAGLRPDMFLYDTLLATLSRYRHYEQQGGWAAIRTGGKIEPGGSDDRIPQIRHRLSLSGELSVPDTSRSTVYDTFLEKDIRRFQKGHGLDDDGIIGAGTLRELNVSALDRANTIRVNLERVRWVAGDIPPDYLVVNIAAFRLQLIKSGKLTYTSRVVVGKPVSKTPVFRDRIRYIDFNPTWTVPTSIKNKEIIPGLKKDSTYLEKNHMVLLDSKGNEVDVKDVDLKKIAPGKFPYLVRQQPGPWNSLGVVKFMFPNEYDIYLHDTPSKSLFTRANRAYSHGCIRVEKPLDLAERLLEGTEWDRKKIDETVESRVTTRVSLSPPLDVLLMYWTCGLTEKGDIFFAPDVYDRDPGVLKELDRSLH